MKRHLSILALAAAATLSACGPRQVEVRTGASPDAAASVGVRVTNNLSQGVNVYVVNGGNDMFLRQVAANSSETLDVRGVAAGTSVTLKATTVDGTRTYTKENVVLSGTYVWQVP
ncbi:MAG TPA: hypothetical protein VFJ74_00390 [Gemmatimonadaceae bacterium]|nr:hypothetical protein [Gemmatimonadaceae bacterium]